ncbi:MAG: hybrid sensor histidine kinase/response regulator [Desulfobacterales bacterium]|nr:hybrid sensor histidine kinase/response regulator [Desulfobacterales bacterium]
MKPLSKSKILIVDDTEASIDVLVEAIGSLYEVMVAMNGVEALEIAIEDVPDLILLDIVMPEMDGYEICRKLKTNQATCDIPVIFITAMNDIGDETRGLEIGAIDYITKPISPPIVRARVKNHLDLKHAYTQLKKQKHQLEEQNKELIESARLREDVERIAKHDLKTPLNGIINFSKFIKQQGGLNEKQSKYISFIEECGYKMLDMINLSLELFKMEQGLYKFNPTSVNIVTVIYNVIDELYQFVKYKQLKINLQVNGIQADRDAVFMVQAETLLCYSMLANLIKNAIEASPKGDIIGIFLEDKEGEAMIRIHNRGSVPIDVRNRFFEKFATSGKSKGTGLGAYSAKLIAETQNGKISMLTSDEEGTSLIIYLRK